MKKTLYRFLSMVMCAMLLFGMLPVNAIAGAQLASDAFTVGVDKQQNTQPGDVPAATFLVRFLAYDGTVLKELTVPGGGGVSEEEYPSAERDGYDFLGWHNGEEIITTLEDIQQDITLTAQYVQLFTITYENWDGSFLWSVPKVRAGSRFTATEHYNGTEKNPTREGFGFQNWEPSEIESVSGDTTITAAFKPLLSHTIIINYIFENQRQAHDPYIATVYDGYPYNETIPSPEIPGYTPDQPTVAIQGDIYEDQNILVTYTTRLDTQYKIVHLLQDVTGDGYTVANTVTRTGRTGSLTTVTQADVMTGNTGFSPVTNIATCNDYIAADGSTSIEIKYDRDIHVVMYDTADGTYIAPQVGRYGEAVVKPTVAPTRNGYTFDGWNTQIPDTIGAADVTITAKWKVATNTLYTVVYLMQDPNDLTAYTFASSETYTGTTGTLVSQNASWTQNAAKWKSTDRIPETTDDYYQRAGFQYAENDAASKTILADGSTVVFVKFNRVSKTIHFYTLKNNGTWTEKYHITAPYGALISNSWITVAKPNTYTNYTWYIYPWNDPRIDYNPFISIVQYMPLSGYSLYGRDTGGENYAIIYMTECGSDESGSYAFGGHTYKQSGIISAFTYSGYSSLRLTPEDMTGFIIKGFKYYSVRSGYNEYIGYEPNDATFTWNSSKWRFEIFVYFNRMSYTITYHNGGSTFTSDPIPYEASLENSCKDVSGQRPANVPSDYLFDGWYTDAACAVKFTGWGGTMPANNLTVYACWKKPVYQVDFLLNYEGGGVYATQTVTKNATATELAAPVRAGYQFDYWYYEENGVQKIYTFSMGITGALTLKAHWTAMAVAYTVRYVDINGNAVRDSNGTVLAAKTAQGKAGALITEDAPSAYTSDKKPLFPDRASSSITLKASSEQNIITFQYTRVPTVYYLVRFVDSDGVERAPAIGPKATSKATVTEPYVNISGYSPNAYQITRNLAAETDPANIVQNIITFKYTKNPTGIYLVKHYLQNLDNNSYTIDSSATETFANMPLGATANGIKRDYPGYSFVPGISTASGVVYSGTANPLTLYMYYNRNIVEYSASFVDADTNETIASDITGRARYGKTVTVFASAIPGYQLDESRSAASESIQITTNAAENHITFYYKVREGIAVSIRFLDEAGNSIAGTIVHMGKDEPAIRFGRQYSYTLPETDATRTHNNEVFTLLGGIPLTQTVTITQDENYIDYIYAAKKYTLTFEGNNSGGGSGIAPQQHRYGDTFPMPAQIPAYGVYRFEGWSADLAVRGKVYETQSALGAVTLVGSAYTMPNEDVTLYAVWSHLEVSLSYACTEAITGSLPAGVTVAVGGSATVAGAGSMSRAGYTFAGWKRKNELGQLVNPAYGPEVAWEHTITLNENTTLYASWTPLAYTIAYGNNLPAPAAARFTNPNTATGYTVESATLTLMDSSCNGYTFLGWYADASYQTPVTALPTGSVGNRTFYARFTPEAVDGLSVQGYAGVYDGNSHSVQVLDTKAQLLAGIDTISYSPSGTYTNVTGGSVAVTATLWRDGVSLWSGTANVSITPKPITLTAEDINAVYSGAAHMLNVTVPAGENGAVNAADASAIQNTLTYTMGGVSVANSFTDAMPATMVAVGAQNANYIITPAYPTVKIDKRNVFITADSLKVTYNAQQHSVTTWAVTPASGSEGLAGSDTVAAVSLSDNVRTDVGVSYPMPYGATLSTGNAANYSFQYIAGTLTVEKSNALTVNLAANNHVYDGAAHGFTINTSGVPVTLEYRTASSGWVALAGGESLPAYTDAGTYSLRVRASNPNYSNMPTAEATLSITPRDVTLRAGSLTAAYNGAEHTVTDWSTDEATLTTGLVGGDTITAVAFSGNTRTTPGENDVGIEPETWSAGANPDNYNILAENGTLTVTANPGALQISADDVTVTYDGDDHRLLYTVTAPENCPYDVYYLVNGSDWVKLASGDMLPKASDTGEYAYALKVESSYYTGTGEDTATLTINRRPISLLVGESLGNVYNGVAYTVGYTIEDPTADSGLVPGDTVHAVLNGATQTAAGVYAVTFDRNQTNFKQGSRDVSANYAPDYADGTLEIVKAATAAVDGNARVTYNGQPHDYAVPVLADADGHTLADVDVAWSETPLDADAAGWNLGAMPARTAVKAIGADGQPEAYVLYVRLSHANYATQIVQTSLTVEPAQVTLTADSITDFPYTLMADGTPKVWRVNDAHWQIDGLDADTLYAGDRIAYALANNTQSAVDGGHAVTFDHFAVEKAANAKNYKITTADGYIRVVQGSAASLITAKGFTALYDAQPHALDYPLVSVTSLDDTLVDRTGDFTFTYTVTHNGESQTGSELPAFTEAGEYSVRIEAASALHAAPTAVTVEVTVQQRQLVLTSQTIAYPYDGAAHSAAILANVSGYAPGTDHSVAQTGLAIMSGGQNSATLAGSYAFAIDTDSVAVMHGTVDVTANYDIQTVPGLLTITPTQVSAAQIAMDDVDVVYNGEPQSLTLPQTLTLGSQTVDLTNTERFQFAYKSLDTQTAGAVATTVAGNPVYTDASAHSVSLTITDLTGSLVFETVTAGVTIRKRDVTITPESKTFVYDGAPHTVDGYDNPKANGDTGFIGDDYATLTLTGNTRSSAGTNDIGWIYPAALAHGDISNYNLLQGKGTITVLKAQVLPLTLTATGGVYNAAAYHYTFTVGEPDTDALRLYYSTDGMVWTPFTTAGQLPAYTDAGEHPLHLRAQSDNFETEADVSATLSIAQRPVAVTPVSDHFVYDGTEKALADYAAERAGVNGDGTPVGTRGLIGSDAITVSLTGNGLTDVGESTVGCENAQPVGATRIENYAIQYNTGTLSVTPRSGLSVTLTAENAEYDGLAHGYTFETNAIGESTFYYSINGGDEIAFTSADELPSLTDVGSLRLKVHVVNPNYDTAVIATQSLTVTAAPLTLRVLSAAYAYDGEPHSLVAEAEGLVGGDELAAFALSPESATEVGRHSVIPMYTGLQITNALRGGNLTGNYSIQYETGILTIVGFTLEEYVGVYDGETHSATLLVPEVFVPLYDIAFEADGVPVADMPAFVDAGTYAVTVTLTPKDAASGLPTLTKTVNVQLGAKPFELQAETISKVYDGQYSSIRVSLPAGAAINAADAALILENVTFTVEGAAIENRFVNAGMQTVTVASSAENYLITPASVSVAIAQRPVTLTAGTASRQYNEQTLTVSYTTEAAVYGEDRPTGGTGLLREHTLTAVLENDSQIDVCNLEPVTFDQAATQIEGAGGSVLANYAVQYVDGSITITKASSLTLKLSGYDAVYDAQAHGIQIVSILDGTRSVAADRFVWSYGETAETLTGDAYTSADVCDVLVYVQGVSTDGNYPDVSGYARLHITKRPVLVTPATEEYPYDSTLRTVTDYRVERATLNGEGGLANERGLLGSDALRVTLTNASHAVPGVYELGWNSPVMESGSLDNYSLAAGGATLRILPASTGLSIQLEGDTLIYNGLEHRLAYTVTAPTNCPYTVEYALGSGETYTPVTADGLLPAMTDAGDYPVRVRVTSEYFVPGYVQYSNATLSILKRPITIASETNTFVYDQTEHYVSGLYNVTPTTATAGLVNAGGISHTLISFGYQPGMNDRQTDVGSHTVRLDNDLLAVRDQDGIDVTDNYDVSIEDGFIEVTPQPSSALPTTRTAQYNGQQMSFALPVLLDAVGAPVTEPVTYYFSVNGSSFTREMPTYANVLDGGYTVAVRITSPNYQPAETTAMLVITPAPITVTADTKDDFYYTVDQDGNALQWQVTTARITEGELYLGETLAYTLSGNTMSDIGQQDVVLDTCAVLLGSRDVSANYAIRKENGHMQVNAGIESAEMTTSNAGGQYNGEAYTLPQPTVSVMADNGSYVDQTAEYQFVYETTREGDGKTETFRDGLPSFVDEGIYRIAIKATSRRQISPVTGSATITITKRPLTLTSGSNALAPFKYNGEAQMVDAWQVMNLGTFATGDDIVAYTFADGFGNQNTDVCDRPVTLTGVTVMNGKRDVTNNYDISYVSGRIVIRPLAVEGALSLTGISKVYNGGAYGIEVGDTLSTPVGNYSLSGDARFTLAYAATPYGGAQGAQTATNPMFIDVTLQTVTVYVTDTSGNLLIAPASQTVEITRREVTITPDSDTVAYDGSAHTVTGYQKPRAAMDTNNVAIGDTGLVGDDDVTVTLTGNGPHTEAGAYTVAWDAPVAMTNGDLGNYTFLHADGLLTINQATGIDISLTAANAVYDGLAHGYTATPMVPAGCAATLEYLNETGAWVPVTAETPLPTYVDAGTYPITVRVSSPNYLDTMERTTTLTISPRPLTVASGDNSAKPFTYNGTAQQVAAAYDASGSLVEGQWLQTATAVFEAGMGNANTDACDRAVLVKHIAVLNADAQDVTANYDIHFTQGHIVILPAEAQALPTADSVGYNAKAHAFKTPVMTGVLSEPVAGASYAYSLTELDAGDEGWIAIDAMPTHIAVLRDGAGNATQYQIYVRITQANYLPVVTYATLLIQPAPITVTADTNDSFPYTMTDENVPYTWYVNTATVSGTLYNGETPVYTLSQNGQATIGGHDVYVDTVSLMFGGTDYTGNYAITRLPGHIAVIRGVAQTAIIASDSSAVYDAQTHRIGEPDVLVPSANNTSLIRTEDFTLTYAATREGSTETWSFDSLADMAFTEAGTYRVTIHAESALHANPADVTVRFTITRRPLTITSESNSEANGGTPYIYNGEEQRVRGDASVVNLVDGQTLASLAYATGFENASVTVCDRDVLLESVHVMDGRTDVTANYAIAYRPGHIVIKPYAISAAQFAPTGVNTEYDGLGHSVGMPETIQTEIGEIVIADRFSVAFETADASSDDGLTGREVSSPAADTNPVFYDVGEYLLTVRLTSLDGCFTVAPSTTTVVITARPLTVSYSVISEEFSGETFTVPRQIDGLTKRDAIRLTEANRSAVHVTRLPDGSLGSLPTTALTLTLTDIVDTGIDRSGNYSVSVVPGSIEILPIPLAITVESQTFQYDATAHTVTDARSTGLLENHTLAVTLDGNSAINVVDEQPMALHSATVTNSLTGEDVTGDYTITSDIGTLSVTAAPLTLQVTSVTLVYDGFYHQPDVYASAGLMGDDVLAAFTLLDMPQRNVGRYSNVKLDLDSVLLTNGKGENVTGNYDITGAKGRLVIQPQSATYTVRYYYDGVLDNDATVTLSGVLGSSVSTYPTRRLNGYVLSRVAYLPLKLTKNADDNVIRVYYVSVNNLVTLDDLGIPLGAGGLNYEVGLAVE